MEKVFAISIALLSFVSQAQADKVDEFIKKQMVRDHLPGISIAIIENGKIIKEKGYGIESLETKKPADAHTLYEIASLGKPIVAVATLKLIESGRIGLEDPISRYVADTPKSWKTITFRSLLSHTSGIKDYVTEIAQSAETADLAVDEIYHRMASQPLNFTPGAKYSYSHSNYLILGMILSNRSNRPFIEYLQESIFKPLDMSETDLKEALRDSKNFAVGYRFQEGKLVEAEKTPGKFADQCLASSVDDLAKFAVALDKGTLLTSEARNLMWSPTVLTDGKKSIYGLGWNTESLNGHRVIGHAGSVGGYSANMTRFPGDKITVIVLTNQRGVNSFQIVKGIALLFRPELGQ